MTHKVMFFICGLVSVLSFSQAQNTNTILQEIEQNNTELKAFKSYEESQKFALKSTNALPNPEVGAYYLPFGNSVSQDYTEVEVKQSFEFPSVYTSRKRLIKKQQEKINIEYLQKRQAILLQAQLYVQKLIAYNKLERVEQERLNNAEKLYNQNEQLFKKGDINILELNKSKVALLKHQFKVENVQTQKNEALLKLENLNGGKPISVSLTDYETDFLLPEKATLWQERLSQNKALQAQQKAQDVAQENVKLAKRKNLPNLALGYNYQGFTNDNVHGVFAGMSIPLWGNKSRRKSAEMQFDFEKNNTNVQELAVKNQFETTYNTYQNLVSKYNNYKATFKSISSDELLLKAYRAGEISFSEYFVELEFYHNAHDAMLEMEKQLHLLKSQLLNHKL